MAITRDTSSLQYKGNNSTETAYPVPFLFFENEHIKVLVTDVHGNQISLTQGMGFTLSGAGTGNGHMQTSEAWDDTHLLTIYRDVPIKQTTSYQEGGKFPAASHERALDWLTMICQQLARRVSRTLRFSEQETDIPPLPSAADRANKVLGFNSAGTPIAVTPISGSADELAAFLADGDTPGSGDAIIAVKQPFTGATIRTQHEKNRETLSVLDFGAKGDGITDDANAIQAAVDAATGKRLYFPSGTYMIGHQINVPSYSYLFGDGIDMTIIKFTNDAPYDDSILINANLDDGNVHTYYLDMTLDGNRARLDDPYYVGYQRPDSSCLVFGNVTYGGAYRVKVLNAVNHGLDVSSGGDINPSSGRREYCHPRSATTYSTKPSRHIVIEDCWGEGCGDDAFTTHYSYFVWFTRCQGRTPAGPIISATAHNAFEADDGSRWIWFTDCYAYDVVRGFVAKCHSTHPPANNIFITNCTAERCNIGAFTYDGNQPEGVSELANNIQIDNLRVINPQQWQNDPASGDVCAISIRSYERVAITGLVAIANGDEAFLSSGIQLTSATRYITITGCVIDNWPRLNASETAVAGISATGTVSNICITGNTIRNCGFRGIVIAGQTVYTITGNNIRLTGSVSGSVGMRLSTDPFGESCVVSGNVMSGYDTATSYGSRTTITGGQSHTPGDSTIRGLLQVGVSTGVARNQLYRPAATNAGDEILRMGGANTSFMLYERGSGGGYGVSVANSIQTIGHAATTNRSINAGGTINASGADYAEYKRCKTGLIAAKGAILGMDSDGNLTDVFADVVGRVYIKSTSPNLVGNDSWGTEEYLCAEYGIDPVGEEPEPDIEGESAHVEWKSRKAIFLDKLETERVKWDRIALCGVAPVNLSGVTSADVGKYLVPAEDGNGKLTAALVSKQDLTMAQVIDAFATIESVTETGAIASILR